MFRAVALWNNIPESITRIAKRNGNATLKMYRAGKYQVTINYFWDMTLIL